MKKYIKYWLYCMSRSRLFISYLESGLIILLIAILLDIMFNEFSHCITLINISLPVAILYFVTSTLNSYTIVIIALNKMFNLLLSDENFSTYSISFLILYILMNGKINNENVFIQITIIISILVIITFSPKILSEKFKKKLISETNNETNQKINMEKSPD